MPRRALPVYTILLLLAIPGPPLAHGGASSGTPPEGIPAIDEAFARGGESAVAGILPLLKDRDLDVRTHAMRRLVEIGELAVDPLLAALADESTRWPASGALLNIGAPAVRKTVLAVKHPDPAVRRGALFILQQLDFPGPARSAASPGGPRSVADRSARRGDPYSGAGSARNTRRGTASRGPHGAARG